jgi:hypothetical protein
MLSRGTLDVIKLTNLSSLIYVNGHTAAESILAGQPSYPLKMDMCAGFARSQAEPPLRKHKNYVISKVNARPL